MITYTTVQNGCQGTVVDYRDLFLVQAVQTNDTAGYVVELVFKFTDKGCIYKHRSNIFQSVEEANAEMDRINAIIYKEQHKNFLTLTMEQCELVLRAISHRLDSFVSTHEQGDLEYIKDKVKDYMVREYGIQ